MGDKTKQLIFVDYEEVHESSELNKEPILRVLYDEYIPRIAITGNRTPTIIYQKEQNRFVIYAEF